MRVVAAAVSAEEFLAGDYPIGSELVDGEVIVNDPEFGHQEVTGRLVVALRAWVIGPGGHGRAGFGGNWVLSDRQVYKPDAWWCAVPPRGSRHLGPPDLAVEVRSAGTWRHDIGPKLRQYVASGTPELWLVDAAAWQVRVVRAAGVAGGAVLDAGQALTTPLLPGFTLILDDLFAGVDPPA